MASGPHVIEPIYLVATLQHSIKEHFTIHQTQSINNTLSLPPSFLSRLPGGLSTTAMVKIQVTDINDNRPIFYPHEYNVSLREMPSISPNSPVIAVFATDRDSGRFGELSYRIVSGNEANIFRLDRYSGEIFIVRPVMLSSQRTHRLDVSAEDGGGLRTLQDAEVYISVIDGTYLPPIFDKPRYNCFVKEDARLGTKVGTVLATSGDSGKCH